MTPSTYQLSGNPPRLREGARPPWRRLLPGLLRRAAAAVALGALLFAAGLPSARAAATPTEGEVYVVKAAYLVRFLDYVTWPESAFAHASAPIVIGVVGENPFGRFLDEIVRERNKQGAPDRPVVVRYWRTVDEIGACHALFAPDTEERRYAQIASRVEAQPVLLVADEVKAGLKAGFHVEFRQTGERMRFAIDQSRAESCGLKLSARLLESAIDVVRPKPPGNASKPAAPPPPPR